MSLLVVVQARTGSTRFPNKVLADLGGRTMLGGMLERIAPLADDPGTEVVVATSDRQGDDAVAQVATAAGVAVTRGSEQDVLQRFLTALEEHPADTVVRLTADCPLMDPQVVRAAVAVHQATGADYTSNTLARTFPDGLDVEVISAAALRWAAEHATTLDEREHVTPHLQRHPRRFLIAQLRSEALAGHERWTVDEAHDLDVLGQALADAALVPDAPWEELLEAFGRHAPQDGVQAVPLATEHRRGGRFVRQWQIVLGRTTLGAANVVVDDGGSGTLEVMSDDAHSAEEAVRAQLLADLQVTHLSTGTGAIR
jgi:spore coat polysaccharide biosynthesis protein SpsF